MLEIVNGHSRSFRDSLAMPSENTVYNALQHVASSLHPYLALANCHTVDVLVYDMWSKVLPQSLGQDLDKISVDTLCQILGPSGRSSEPMLESIKKECPSLHEFLSLLHSLHLNNLGVLSSKEEVYSHLKLCRRTEAPALQLGRLMKEKKMHEVGVMTQLIATLCRELCASWVCDMGAGKGYMSALLAR
ncbi:hypothetical protein FHG87_001955 [Trinorchestia longiramus]|nr:hypothetical protein FHG87_001955 [Trinorchestia longiramus]